MEEPSGSAASSAASTSPKGRSRLQLPLFVSTAVVGLVIVAIAAFAMSRLLNTGTAADLIPVYQEVLKTSFQALAVGALGGLAKLILDGRKAREVAETELRDRRYRFISTLVELARAVDEARLVVRANRSVKSWTDMINDRIIPARARLRDITHELRNWADAGSRVFEDTKSINHDLMGMDSYLRALLVEYGDSKQELGEVQLWAEQAKGKSHEEGEERKRLLNQIWNQMKELPVLGDLMNDGPQYGAYRESYVDALLKMRRSLTPQGTTAPLSSNPP
jgi:hypothetical protein